ncbi:MAG: hypothetical protein JWO22_1424, partial [Frankiales bacterium]|nr:hypothetical protein [Frankiales bacterium]
MTDQPPTRQRVDGSMSLLVDMSAAALDPAYADVARRAEAARSSGAPRPGRPVRTVSLLLVIGAATGVAA